MPLPPDLRRGLDRIRGHLYGGGYPNPAQNAEQLSFLILDHFVKEVLQAKGYLRYVDDFALFHDDPGQLEDWRDRITRYVVECKVLRDSDRKGLAWTVERGVEQTLGYMARCGAEEGHLVVMDRRSGERRDGEGGAGGGGRRQDGRGVVVWTL